MRSPRHAVRRKARRRGFPRTLDVLLAVALVGAFAVVVARVPEPGFQQLDGTARVSDGDSLRLGGQRIRLEGIDAPELDQSCTRDGAAYPCGREARDALARLVDGAPVACESRRQDRYGRLLARCEARGVDLNHAMVEQGWAVAFGDYEDAERAAKAAGRGLWSGTFERPRDWRRVHGGLLETEHGGLSRLADWLREIFGGGSAGVVGPEEGEPE